MEKYFKRKTEIMDKSPIDTDSSNQRESSSKQRRVEFDLKNLIVDPGLRSDISDYHPNDQDKIQRAYIHKGPFQPRDHQFPQKQIGSKLRRFNPDWFDLHPSWLEYSIAQDAAFCLCCYLFKCEGRKQGGGDSFVKGGFTNWNKNERLQLHIGGPNSSHNEASNKCRDLLNQNQHIQAAFLKQSDKARNDYRVRLNASIDCIRFLLHQGLSFRGHDETENSSNQGNFLELLQFIASYNDIVHSVVLKNAPENNKIIAHDIQKDIVNAAATETTNSIIKDLGNEYFSIMVDESRDISHKEQMAVVLRYVNKNGCVVERFLGIVHVVETTALSLKAAIENLLFKFGLSISSLRGQSYDGASNMKGEVNGLKTLILKENACAFYVHCFAHQLQLTLVAIAKNHNQVALLFNVIANLINIVGASCKRRDTLREIQAKKVREALEIGEIQSGKGLNQEIGLKRAGDTRWGSHYGMLLNLIVMFSSIIDVLDIISQNGSDSEQKAEASILLDLVQSFEFIFNLHLMKNILGITNELSQALQRKDQDIVNALKLVRLSNERLQIMRDDGWEPLLIEVSSFCTRFNVFIPDMNCTYIARGRSRRHVEKNTNLHHYRVELFYSTIDMQIQELNNRFSERSNEVLLCVACLDPHDSFSTFDKEKLIQFAKFYPTEFSTTQLMALENQLETYILDMRSSIEFLNIKGIGGLAHKLVETKRDIVYHFVYLLVKLALILPVATASVERAFSAMKIVKNRLRSRMGDQWMNDCLVTYIEKDVFSEIDNEAIMQRFQNMKTRRCQL